MNLSRCCLIILCCSLTCLTARAGELSHLWSQRFGDSDLQDGNSVAVDGLGEVLITGNFQGTVDFGGGPLTSAGARDIFLVKFDGNGNHLWSQRFGDSYDYQLGMSVAVDGAGNVLLTGVFEGTVDFGGGPLTSAGRMDVFLAKFDASGNHLWSNGFGDSLGQGSMSVAVDGLGNSLITGNFQGTVDFGGGPMTAGGEDIYLAKFDPSGSHLWSQSFDASHAVTSNSVAVDGAGGVLLTGSFWGTVDFGGGPMTSAGYDDIFLAKFDPGGSHLWSQRFGGSGYQYGKSVAADSAGDVLLTGYFEGSVYFGGGPLISAGEYDIFLAKFDPSGNHLWSQRFGDSDYQYGESVAVDGVGNVLLTGYFNGTADFGGGPLTSAGAADIYLAKFDPSGNHLWSQRFGDSDTQVGESVAVDSTGDVLLTGYFAGTVDFGGGPLTSAGMTDIFLAKFGSDEPTPVLLSQISAREVGYAVELSWSALSDISITQFEIYRAVSPDVEESRKLATMDAVAMEQTYRDETVVSGETYYYWIGVVDIVGGRERFGPFSITFVGSEDHLLLSSYPNPVVDHTTIRFYVPEPGDVVLGIYDPMGRLVHTLVQAPRPAGTHTVLWDGTNQAGVPVAGGVYFYRLTLNGETQTKRMILVR